MIINGAILDHCEDLGISKLNESGRNFLLIPSGLHCSLSDFLQSNIQRLLAFQVPVRISRRQGRWRDISHPYRMNLIGLKARAIAQLRPWRRFTPVLILKGFFLREWPSFTAN
ncbi:hypothetical protein ACK83U_01045 [Rhizobium sp. WW22]|uniref:hypothetical protein n=1 Tax=Rhizobium sp. WW22 TaxID=3389070 RepID=UPI00399BD727